MDSSANHRKAQPRRRTSTAAKSTSSWCCSFKSPPKSPESLSLPSKTPFSNYPSKKKHHHPPSEASLSKSLNSFPSSPQSSKSGLSIVGRIDPRRILSPGRVSPIDSDPTAELPDPDPTKLSNVGVDEEVGLAQEPSSDVGQDEERENEGSECEDEGVFDVRLSLKGKNGGGCLVLELNSKVLGDNSSIFASLIADCRKGSRSAGGRAARFCRIEVPEVENLAVFRETIELMFEDDVTRRLIMVGAYRAIDILEVTLF